jgi:hypothetical protein
MGVCRRLNRNVNSSDRGDNQRLVTLLPPAAKAHFRASDAVTRVYWFSASAVTQATAAVTTSPSVIQR